MIRMQKNKPVYFDADVYAGRDQFPQLGISGMLGSG
jgi:hypothetical protein